MLGSYRITSKRAKLIFVLHGIVIVLLTLWPLEFALESAAIIDKWKAAEWQIFYRSNGHIIVDKDLILNILVFMPQGFALRFTKLGQRTLLPLLLVSLGAGFLLSFTVESLQLLTPGRVTQLADLWRNTLGAGLGSVCGWLFWRQDGPLK